MQGRNPFYESMREVSPGDVVFSFADTRIIAIGAAKSYCWECPKPLEFDTYRLIFNIQKRAGGRASAHRELFAEPLMTSGLLACDDALGAAAPGNQ
jgi:hypothetical protein